MLLDVMYLPGSHRGHRVRGQNHHIVNIKSWPWNEIAFIQILLTSYVYVPWFYPPDQLKSHWVKGQSCLIFHILTFAIKWKCLHPKPSKLHMYIYMYIDLGDLYPSDPFRGQRHTHRLQGQRSRSASKWHSIHLNLALVHNKIISYLSSGWLNIIICIFWYYCFIGYLIYWLFTCCLCRI